MSAIQISRKNLFCTGFARLRVPPKGLFIAQQHRALTLSCPTQGRRTREPYDRRWGIHPKDVAKPGGTRELAAKLGQGGSMPQPPGYYDRKGRFFVCPEMIPEFVIPDLKDFKLKPYVSYRVSDVKQSEFTAQDLFNGTYAKELVDDFKAGKLDGDKLEEKIEALKLKAKQ